MMFRYEHKYIDSWDVFDLSPRTRWYQAMYCGLTLVAFCSSLMLGALSVLIRVFG